MLQAMFETVVSTFLCAAAVKLLDDYLDREIDLADNRPNFALSVGEGTVIYAVLFIAIAAVLNAKVSSSLFFASYVVGMFNGLEQKLPSRLYSWQESIVIVLLSICLLGLNITVFSLAFILSVQLLDDCLDFKGDQICGQRNFAHRFGLVECALIALILILFAWYLNWQIFLPVFFGSTAFYGLLLYWQGVKRK